MIVRMPRTLSRLARCRTGAAAIEYALLIALISCAVTIAAWGLGANVNTTMTSVRNEMPSSVTIDVQTDR